MIWDCVMLNDELDMLECRLYEYQDIPGLTHVVVEATVDHRGRRKPLHYAGNQDRFARWAGRVKYVRAPVLPESPDPWMREHAQRDYALGALITANADDVVIVADVDEFVPFPLPESPEPAVTFGQRLCMYAVDWEHPDLHAGAVAARAWFVRRFGLSGVRDSRRSYPVVAGGFHLTWLGGLNAQQRKLGTHCHLEMTAGQAEQVSSGRAYLEGASHSGLQMEPVDVDETWPRWIYERKCPESWFRPRQAAIAGGMV